MARGLANHDDANAHKGISRAPQGKSGADEAQREQLRNELERIGRYKQSIKATGLADSPGLLDCPQVLSRLGHRPTEDERRKAAHAALRDAIADLPSTKRLIGQAIMAATTTFEGQIVEQRKKTLEDNYGITKDIFKHRRKDVITSIVNYLMSEQSGAATDRSSDAYRRARIDIECLANDAARLEHLWRGYLFICEFTHAFPQIVSQWPRTPFIGAVTGFLDTLYEAHIDLVVSAGYCFDHADYSHRDRIAANLPTEVVTELPDMLSFVIGTPQPFSTALRERICQHHLNPDGDLHARRLEMKAIHAHWTIWACSLPLSFDGAEYLLKKTPSRLAAVTAVTKRLTAWLNIMPKTFAALEVGETVQNYYGIQGSTVIYDQQRDTEEPFSNYLQYYWTYREIIGRGNYPFD